MELFSSSLVILLVGVVAFVMQIFSVVGIVYFIIEEVNWSTEKNLKKFVKEFCEKESTEMEGKVLGEIEK